jgi:hypothetical protein
MNTGVHYRAHNRPQSDSFGIKNPKHVTLLYKTIYSQWMPRHKHNYQTVNAVVMNDSVSNRRIQTNLCDEAVIYGRYKTLSKKTKTFKNCLNILCP